MAKVVVTMLLVVGLASSLWPAPASAADLCFQDQLGRQHGVWVVGIFGPVADVVVSQSVMVPPGLGTSLLTGGVHLDHYGQAVFELRSVAFGMTLGLVPPGFTSGVGTEWFNESPSSTVLTLTPASCLSSLP